MPRPGVVILVVLCGCPSSDTCDPASCFGSCIAGVCQAVGGGGGEGGGGPGGGGAQAGGAGGGVTDPFGSVCNGCTDSSGRCYAGWADDICGSHAASCRSCGMGSTCTTAGSCVSTAQCARNGLACQSGAECCSGRCSLAGRCAGADDVCAGATPFTQEQTWSSGTSSTQRLTVFGTLATYSDDVVFSCAAGSAADRFHRFTVRKAGVLRTSIQGASFGQHFALALYRTCTNEMLCGADALPTATLQPGDYVIGVRGTTATMTAYTLTVEIESETGTCRAPNWNIDVPVVTTDFIPPWTVDDDTRVGGSSYEPSCSASGTPDLLGVFTLNGPVLVALEVTPKTAGFRPAIELRRRLDTTCSRVQSLACSAGNPAKISEILPAGTYEVIVDSATATSGVFHLEVDGSGATGRYCDLLPYPLLPDDTGVATSSSFVSSSQFDEYGYTKWYKLKLAQARQVRLVVNPAAGATYTPQITTRTGSCGGAYDVFPAPSPGTSAVFDQTVPAGNMYFGVSALAGSGSYDLQLKVQ